MDEHGIEEHTKTEGYNAAYNGVNLSNNPYIDPPFATWWREGFLAYLDYLEVMAGCL
jgi:hypothetical protein